MQKCISSQFSYLLVAPVSIPELPPLAQPKIPTLLHCLFPLFRLLLLITLVPAIAYPRISFVPASEARETEGLVSGSPQEESSLLLPAVDGSYTGQGLTVGDAAGNNSMYGTFRQTARSLVPTTGTSTRSQTPTPSEGRDVIPVSFNVFHSSLSD